MKTSSNLKRSLFLITMFIVPALLSFLFYYYIIRTPIVNRDASIFKSLPYYGPKTLDTKGDTVYYSIAPFQLITQSNDLFDSREMQGNIYLVNFFYTQCKADCIRKASEMLRIQEKLHYLKTVKQLSISIRPEDNVAALLDFSQRAHNDKTQWIFAKTEQNTANQLAANNFLLMQNDTLQHDSTFVHSTKTILIDREGRIRGYYNGDKPADNNRLMDEVKVLAASYSLGVK
jgi:protein SCO1